VSQRASYVEQSSVATSDTASFFATGLSFFDGRFITSSTVDGLWWGRPKRK
jgi:hypothetical protein